MLKNYFECTIVSINKNLSYFCFNIKLKEHDVIFRHFDYYIDRFLNGILMDFRWD